MRRLLALALPGVIAATMVLALTCGQALASHIRCADVITQDTTLDSDLVCSSEPALTIQADNNVTLDLGGHTIRLEREGVGTAITADPYAPSCCREGNVTIESGVLDHGGVSMLYPYRPTVRGLTLTGGAGIWLAVSYEAVIEDNEILTGGIDLEVGDGEIRHNVMRGGGIGLGQGAVASITDNLVIGGGIGLFRGGGEIARNRILDSTGPSISFDVASPGDVHDNVISRNGVGVAMFQSRVDSLRRNVIAHNLGEGITAEDYSLLDARDNVISGNSGNGIRVNYNSAVTAEHNRISHNGADGVLVDGTQSRGKATARLIGNTISANALDGVHVGEFTFTQPFIGVGPPLLEGNRADRNGDDGIDTKNPDTTLTDNHAWFNDDLGIEAVLGVTGSGNWAKHDGNPAQCVPVYLCSTTGKPKK